MEPNPFEVAINPTGVELNPFEVATNPMDGAEMAGRGSGQAPHVRGNPFIGAATAAGGAFAAASCFRISGTSACSAQGRTRTL